MTKHISTLCITALTLAATVAATSCQEDIDNTYSRNLSVIQLTPSADYVVLNENTPDDIALTLEWNEAHPYGNDFITTYKYQLEAIGSKMPTLSEYEDDGIYRRSYTHAQLQQMLTEHFGCLTSSVCEMQFNITASFEGPRMVVPDIATATVKVKTYGPKQYRADVMTIAGEAADGREITLTPVSEGSLTYTWNGALAAGTINFACLYGDEHNALSPANANEPITGSEMDAVMVDAAQANYWVIPEAGNYRINVSLEARTVKIVPAGSIIEMDRLFLAGTATGGDDIEVPRTLEDDNLYAWRGELKAGQLYMPLMFNEATAVSFAPKTGHDICDGTPHEFTQVATTATAASYWEIPADGTYRIVVDLDQRMVTIYSAATDMPNLTVSYNNTVDGINPYSQEVTELWMYGGFNAAARDTDLKAGFQRKYKLQQSMANPYVFVYQGDALPRSTSTDDWSKTTAVGALNFLVSSIENNVYAFGSTADATRNKNRGYLSVNNGETHQLVGGQSHNRYAYFCVPENCTYVVVDIKNLTVYFGNK